MDWLFHANIDYLCAKTLSDDERLYPSAAFHCQQCIEKALKAYLLLKKGKLFDGHNLTWLLKQAAACSQSDNPQSADKSQENRFLSMIPKTVSLNRCYIETRYPADVPSDIDVDSMIAILEYTSDMLDYISKQMRSDILNKVK